MSIGDETIDEQAEVLAREDAENGELFLELLADRIVGKLSASVIPSSVPAEVGEWIREACDHGLRQWIYTIPLMGPMAMFAEFRFNPDGTFNLELKDTNANPFWHGTFRPAEQR